MAVIKIIIINSLKIKNCLIKSKRSMKPIHFRKVKVWKIKLNIWSTKSHYFHKLVI